MIPGRMPAAGDGLDPNGINQADRKLNCVGCHTPIQRTGKSPRMWGRRILVCVGTDLLGPASPQDAGHRCGAVGRGRGSLVISRLSTNGRGEDTSGDERSRRVFNTFDLPPTSPTIRLAVRRLRPMAGSSGRACNGIGKDRPAVSARWPSLFERANRARRPAGTVTTNRKVTNPRWWFAAWTMLSSPPSRPMTCRLPMTKTRLRAGAGCPLPQGATNVSYGLSPQDVICPP